MMYQVYAAAEAIAAQQSTGKQKRQEKIIGLSKLFDDLIRCLRE